MMGLLCLALMPWTLVPGTPAWCMAMVENPSARMARAWLREVHR